MCMPQGPILSGSLDEQQAAFLLAQIFLIVNNHRWTHSASCFKKSVRSAHYHRSVCRYLFPKDRVARTSLENDVISVQRPSFIFKYVFKDQHTEDSKMAVQVASFARRRATEDRQRIEDDVPQDTNVIARRRIAGLAISTTNMQEMALPLSAHYILNDSAGHLSHQFERLFLGQYLTILTGDSYEALLVKVSSSHSEIGETPSELPAMRSIETLPNYTERAPDLDHLSLYEFTCYWQVRARAVKLGSKLAEDSDVEHSDDNRLDSSPDRLRFRTQRPSYKSLYLQRRKLPVVPHIAG